MTPLNTNSKVTIMIITKPYEQIILKLISIENAIETLNKYDAPTLKAMIKILNYHSTTETTDWKITAIRNLNEQEQKTLLNNNLINPNQTPTPQFYQVWEAIETITGLELYTPNPKTPLKFAKKYHTYKKITNLNTIDALKQLGYKGTEPHTTLLNTYNTFKEKIKNKKNWAY
jgi:hypothetical protein